MPLQGNLIVIDLQDAKLPAYLSKPQDSGGRKASIIIVHDWMGLGNFTKVVADRYASLGYVALAPDLYLGSAPKDQDEARKLSSSVTPQISKKLLDATVVYLRALDIPKIGITGFCFGGSQAFNQACQSPDLTAGVIFYATRIPDDDRLRNISAPLLMIYGDQDQNLSAQEARQLEQKLKTMGKDAKLLLYPGAPHAFFNEENKQNFRAEAAKDSWEKTVEFFNSQLMQDW
jgi:carboxymethylenebutenolidase